MRAAAELAARGAPHGSAVIADEQTAGQGRLGRVWHSEKGSGLYVSIVLRVEPAPILTLALGLATVEAIAAVTGLECDLRWPNDVMSRDKKLAGILVQLHDSAAIAGIGINVNHQSFPPEIAAEATALRIETGRDHSREELLGALLPAADSFCGMLAAGRRDDILRLFARRSSYATGRRVRAGKLTGTTAGIDESGFLILRQDDGAERVIVAGGVRPV